MIKKSQHENGDSPRKDCVVNKKLLHPSVDVLRVDGTDTEALEFAMLILHHIGWQAQQCGIDYALSWLKEVYNRFPNLFIPGCAHGSAAFHHILGREVESI